MSVPTFVFYLLLILHKNKINTCNLAIDIADIKFVWKRS